MEESEKTFRRAKGMRIMLGLMCLVVQGIVLISMFVNGQHQQLDDWVLASAVIACVGVMGIVYWTGTVTVTPKYVESRSAFTHTRINFSDVRKIEKGEMVMAVKSQWKSISVTQDFEGRDELFCWIERYTAHAKKRLE